mmetsp:Transcript_30175/g.28833  ORF Transcript_30175/g.28833 Transcript_30175/m.28833 type:complete len:82 (+) Transcript_30175:907-1152(+)
MVLYLRTYFGINTVDWRGTYVSTVWEEERQERLREDSVDIYSKKERYEIDSLLGVKNGSVEGRRDVEGMYIYIYVYLYNIC